MPAIGAFVIGLLVGAVLSFGAIAKSEYSELKRKCVTSGYDDTRLMDGEQFCAKTTLVPFAEATK